MAGISGELGMLINLESQTGKTYWSFSKHNNAIEEVAGKKVGESISYLVISPQINSVLVRM